MPERHAGRCICGAVRFSVEGSLPPPDACHCSTCRKVAALGFASTDVPRGALTVDGAVTWYATSAKVRRGFCGTCGTPLFFDPIDHAQHGWIAVAMGAFDGPTGTALAKHVFVAEKGDYYTLPDDVPQHAR